METLDDIKEMTTLSLSSDYVHSQQYIKLELQLITDLLTSIRKDVCSELEKEDIQSGNISDTYRLKKSHRIKYSLCDYINLIRSDDSTIVPNWVLPHKFPIGSLFKYDTDPDIILVDLDTPLWKMTLTRLMMVVIQGVAGIVMNYKNKEIKLSRSIQNELNRIGVLSDIQITEVANIDQLNMDDLLKSTNIKRELIIKRNRSRELITVGTIIIENLLKFIKLTESKN